MQDVSSSPWKENRRQITLAAAESQSDDPIIQGINAISGQISTLLEPYYLSRADIPEAVFAAVFSLVDQADALAGGSAIDYLTQHIVSLERELAAARQAFGNDQRNEPPYPIKYCATIQRPAGLFYLRGDTAPYGQYTLFVPRDGQILDVKFYDSRTRQFGEVFPNLDPQARYSLPAVRLRTGGDELLDFDQDGLPDVLEDVFGTDPFKADTDGDGIRDGAEVDQATNPLDGLPAQIGIIATARTPATALDISAANGRPVIAEGTNGVAIFDTFRGMGPTLVAQVTTQGTAVAVASEGALVAIADGESGLATIDLSNPQLPGPARYVDLGGDAQAVAIAGGVAFVGLTSGEVVSLDVASGTILDRVYVDNAQGDVAVHDVAVEGETLLALFRSELRAYRVIDGRMEFSSTAQSDWAPDTIAGRKRLFVGGGMAYAATPVGYENYDVRDPAAIKRLTIARFNGPTSFKQMVVNGSGLGVAAVGALNSPQSPHDVYLYDVSNPLVNTNFLTLLPTPGLARSVSIHNGLAYVADGDAGLQVINYLPYDSRGRPPAISLAASFSLSPPQVEEGKPARVTAQATDDVQVRNVEFYIDGALAESDGSFPFEFRFSAPSISATKTNFSLRAKAFDTGGNTAETGTVTVALLADTTPPGVVQLQPVGGDKVVSKLVAYMSEPIAPATVNDTTFQLFNAGADGIAGTADDVPVVGSVTAFRPGVNIASLTLSNALPAGLYRAVLAPSITDLHGNSLGSQFDWRVHVGDAVMWTRYRPGLWQNPLNWNTGKTPDLSDDVMIDVPANITVTYGNSRSSIRNLNSANALEFGAGFFGASLSIQNNAQIDNDLIVSAGTLSVSNVLQVAKALKLTGGTVTRASILAGSSNSIISVNSDVPSTLDGVILNTDLTVSDSILQITNGLTLNGVMTLSASSNNLARLFFIGTQSLNGRGEVRFDKEGNHLVLPLSGTLTIGSNIVIRGGSGEIGNATLPLINLGTISADGAGTTIIIRARPFTNEGTIGELNGGKVVIVQ